MIASRSALVSQLATEIPCLYTNMMSFRSSLAKRQFAYVGCGPTILPLQLEWIAVLRLFSWRINHAMKRSHKRGVITSVTKSSLVIPRAIRHVFQLLQICPGFSNNWRIRPTFSQSAGVCQNHDTFGLTRSASTKRTEKRRSSRFQSCIRYIETRRKPRSGSERTVAPAGLHLEPHCSQP